MASRQLKQAHKTTKAVDIMDKDRVKGAANDAAGRVKRQVGEWTGDPNAQVEGSTQQLKGKAQKAWAAVKDAARQAKDEVDREKAREAEHQRERDREQHQERAKERHP
jgi:uncharacterized protein YjbJ (UPF0337 family)